MANARQQHKSKQNARETVRRLREATAEDTGRMGETAAAGMQSLARGGADVMQRNAELVQTMMRSSLEMAKLVMGQSYDQFSPSLSPSENDMQRNSERSTDKLASLLPTSAAASTMNGLSQEYFAFVQRQVQQGLNNINELSRCRTPQDVAAVQMEILRQTIETVMQSGRRIAEMSVELAGAATKQIQRPAA